MLFGLPPQALHTIHKGQFSLGMPSPRVWARAVQGLLAPDGLNFGRFAGSNYMDFGGMAPSASLTLPSATVPGPNGYGVYIDGTSTQGSILPVGDGTPGVKIVTGATDNHESWLQTGGGVGALGRISNVAGADKLTIFETCISIGSVADNVSALFSGLAVPGCNVADTKVDDTGVMVNKGFIGFGTVHTNGGTAGTNAKLAVIYKASGQTQQTVIATLQTLVADTLYQPALVYDPAAPPAKRISIYLNNELQTTYITAAQIAAATFPNGVYMSHLAGVKNGSAAASTLTEKFWGYYQAA